MFDLLKAYKAEQDAEREKLGSRWNDYDRIFVKWDGRPMNNGTPYLWLRDLCVKNNLRFCDVHSFRHAHASILINAGVDVATVSADLGHSNSMTTVNTPKGHTRSKAAEFDTKYKRSAGQQFTAGRLFLVFYP